MKLPFPTGPPRPLYRLSAELSFDGYGRLARAVWGIRGREGAHRQGR
ncbi:hypothetical protein KFZ76_22860 [Methylovulum psychrotolerans]|nr:hypothetical protein [Methylovulum psychrotolerans]MBT9100545.1 hypothetical protein [Methylovulum psychrotolerans]